MTLPQSVVACAMLVAIASCSGDSVTDPTMPLAACTSNVSISVGTGTTPTFTWSPACTVLALIVEGSDGGDAWFIWGNSQGIAPGVRYASVPSGAVQDDSPETLQAGRLYDVSVFRGTAGENILGWSDAEAAQRLIGNQAFRP